MNEPLDLIAEVRDVLLANASTDCPMTIGEIGGHLGGDVTTADVIAALREMRKDGDVIRHDGPPVSYELTPGQGGDTAPTAPPPNGTGLEDYDQSMTAESAQPHPPAAARANNGVIPTRDLVVQHLTECHPLDASLDDMVDALKIQKKTIAKALTDLVREGRIVRVERGRYQLAVATGERSQQPTDAVHSQLSQAVEHAVQARDTYLASINDPVARHLQDGVRSAQLALTEYEVRRHG